MINHSSTSHALFDGAFTQLHARSSNVASMGLLPDTQNYGCACAGNAGNVFPVTAGKRSRHASRHVRDARAVMHAGIANYRFPLKSAAGECIPGACATCNFTYLVRGPCRSLQRFSWDMLIQINLIIPTPSPPQKNSLWKLQTCFNQDKILSTCYVC